MSVQIRYVKTIVGYWNLYFVNGDPKPPIIATVSPVKMSELFAGLSPKAKFGCGEISATQADELFGNFLKEVKIA